MTWPSNAVGAVIYKDTSAACIQSAQSAKARDSSGAGNIAAKLPDQTDISAAISQAVTETVSKLQDKNDVATFADVSLFQICTIAVNNNLSAPDTVSLVKAVLDASVNIAKARPTIPFNNSNKESPPPPSKTDPAAKPSS